jgi:hypothetical protein
MDLDSDPDLDTVPDPAVFKDQKYNFTKKNS